MGANTPTHTRSILLLALVQLLKTADTTAKIAADTKHCWNWVWYLNRVMMTKKMKKFPTLGVLCLVAALLCMG
jgi:hypothetical protein